MNQNGRRILYIEDNAMNWRLVQRLLSQAGYDMYWAESGLKGCEMAVELKPAMILLDINLPGLSGFEVATHLRQYSELDGTVIVALSAKTLRIDRETALVTGCDGFMSKPIDPFLFVGQVESYLQGHRDLPDQSREGVTLRQFSQQVVKRLEIQLKAAEEGNRKLLDIQGQLEQRNHHLSHLLSLSQEIIPSRNPEEVLSHIIGQLRHDLRLGHLLAYRLHPNGAYFRGLVWSDGNWVQAPILPLDHPLVAKVERLAGRGVCTEEHLRKAEVWAAGLELGMWDPRSVPLLLALKPRSSQDGLWGFLAADRQEEPFLPFESELIELHAGMLQVSLENADLSTHLEETRQALGTSYEGLDSAYVALKEAERARDEQHRKAALGTLFMNMTHQLNDPVQILKDESAVLSAGLDHPGTFLDRERGRYQHSLVRIQRAILRVDALVQALIRRSGQGELSSPEWLHLHEFIRQELDLMRAEGSLPEGLVIDLDFQAPEDRLFGLAADFSEMLGHLVIHALEGHPSRLVVRTRCDDDQFRIDVEDDGPPIQEGQLAEAFEPFSSLKTSPDQADRRPGEGLPACTQLAHAYGGTVQILNLSGGSMVRVSLPMG